MSCQSKQPVVRFLKLHRWEWIHIDTICKAVRCTPKEVRQCVGKDAYKNSINRRGDEYRYVGNPKSTEYRIVKVLKENYPRWMSGAEISKLANIGISASYYISGMKNILPIEYEQNAWKHHLHAIMYRYVPCDPRSLPDVIRQEFPSQRDRDNNAAKNRILNTLKKYPCRYFSSSQLSEILGFRVRSIGTLLHVMSADNKHLMQKRSRGTYGTTMYAYFPSAKLKQLQTSEDTATA